jgi:hypothetical protein
MRYWLYGFVAVMCLAMLAAVQVKQAKAHSWYPPHCCHDRDCAPVTSVSFVASDPSRLPNMVVSTRYGTVIVPPGFKTDTSRDGAMHACIRPDDHGTPRLICLFLPPSI